MAIVATVTDCVQVGLNEFRDKSVSRVFEENRTIGDMLSWARATLGKEHVEFTDLKFSEFTGISK
jgi:hypothetical protein